jgi:5-methylcytosine-specific restriction endonuclease McrA
MPNYTDSLRGYSQAIHQRDQYVCCYCGADGKMSFEVWLTLTSEHLLPKGHPNRDNPHYIVTACQFCNTADNRYFDKAAEYHLQFDNMTPEQLIEQRKPYVAKVRREYRAFWESKVKPT